jgi:hypothetical protein
MWIKDVELRPSHIRGFQVVVEDRAIGRILAGGLLKWPSSDACATN